GWMLRYIWTEIKDEEERFDIANAQPVNTETTTQTTISTTTETAVTEATTTETLYREIDKQDSFTDTITNIVIYPEPNQYGWIGQIDFAEHGIYFLNGSYSADDSTNLANYETGDIIEIDFWYKGNQVDSTFDGLANITRIDKIELVQNVRETTSTKDTETITNTTVTTTDDVYEDILMGDANCDGKVTIADATAIIQALGNSDGYALSEQGEVNADVVDKGDGVTGADANAIQAIEAGFLKQTDFPVAKADFDALMKND
ncbi:MAG: hypothetical protein K2G83_05020, partial [Ruminococcus sp.]|nr:hypothetical protein [Ruminococcus sp.]